MAAEARPYEIQVEGGIPVTLPSGDPFFVLTDGEADYLRDKITRYLSDNHFCLPAGELVTTTTGPVPVEEISAGTRVLGLNPEGDALEWHEVLHAHRLAPQPVLSLRTGNRVLRCSPGHQVLARRCQHGRGLRPSCYTNEWVRADQLTRGDILVAQDGSPDDDALGQEFGIDFHEMAGLFVGDGLTVSGRYARFCRSEDAVYMDHSAANAQVGSNDTRYSFDAQRRIRKEGKYLDRYGKGGIAPAYTRYSRLLEVCHEEAEPMFDLAVAGGHSFVASGLVTHNTNVSDMLDIDKLVSFELLVHRWSLWLSRGRDYYDEDINTRTFADLVSSYSTEIRQVKKALGVDKSTRDRTRGDDSIPALWDNLQRRAREFGYARNEQYYQVLTSFQRVKALITFHDNCDETERKENAVTLEDVFEVIREEIAAFDAIDEEFRFAKQRMWVREN